MSSQQGCPNHADHGSVMSDRNDDIHWAPRLKPALIRRLYTMDARGIVDEDLIDEVGYGLLARCESIRRVTERCCPQCGERLEGVLEQERNRTISCPSCGWQSTWDLYLRSYKNKRLHGGRATVDFLRFLDEFPKCRTPQQKMLVIDRLIHAVHEWMRKTLTLPAAENIIQAKRSEVIELLDDLAYGDRRGTERAGIRAMYFQKLDESREPTLREARAIKQLHTGLSQMMSEFYSEKLETSVDVDLAFLDRTTYDEVIEFLSNPTCTYTFAVEPLSGPAMFDYSQPVVEAFIAQAKKTTGSPNVEARIVMDKIIARNLADLETIWKPVEEIQISDAELKTNTHDIQLAKPDDPVFLVSHAMTCSRGSGLISICYPVLTLESILPRLIT
jgi:hypothetical protein